MVDLIQVDDLSLEVRWSKKRKSVGLTVDRDGHLIIHAPVNCSPDTLQNVIRQKKQWINSKLDIKQATLPNPRIRQYVTGEGFYYLGKSYRLSVIDPNPSEAFIPPLRFFKSRFLLRRDERPNAREHFINWYTTHAKGWLPPRITALSSRLGVSPSSINITDLQNRWGSCSEAKTVSFHWRVMMLPTNIIEYVIVHELAHLIETAHSVKFWNLIEQVIPEMNERKRWLQSNGANYIL